MRQIYHNPFKIFGDYPFSKEKITSRDLIICSVKNKAQAVCLLKSFLSFLLLGHTPSSSPVLYNQHSFESCVSEKLNFLPETE